MHPGMVLSDFMSGVEECTLGFVLVRKEPYQLSFNPTSSLLAWRL